MFGGRTPSLIALLWIVGVSGCAAVPVPILASAGVGVAQFGTGAFINGELQAAFHAPLATVHNAVLQAATELGYPVLRERLEEQDSVVSLQTSGNKTIRIDLFSSSPVVTRINIRVDVFGDQAVSRLLAGRIAQVLEVASTVD